MNKPEPMKYAYSFDEERYHGEFNSIEEALSEARSSRDDEGAVWIGRIKPAKDFLRERNPLWLGERVEEEAEYNLADEIGWEDQIITLTKDQKIELGKLITEWLCDNASFNCYGVADVKEYPLGEQK